MRRRSGCVRLVEAIEAAPAVVAPRALDVSDELTHVKPQQSLVHSVAGRTLHPARIRAVNGGRRNVTKNAQNSDTHEQLRLHQDTR